MFVLILLYLELLSYSFFNHITCITIDVRARFQINLILIPAQESASRRDREVRHDFEIQSTLANKTVKR